MRHRRHLASVDSSTRSAETFTIHQAGHDPVVLELDVDIEVDRQLWIQQQIMASLDDLVATATKALAMMEAQS